jgi:hypothetical protein
VPLAIDGQRECGVHNLAEFNADLTPSATWMQGFVTAAKNPPRDGMHCWRLAMASVTVSHLHLR